jgi:hypothetical protein
MFRTQCIPDFFVAGNTMVSETLPVPPGGLRILPLHEKCEKIKYLIGNLTVVLIWKVRLARTSVSDPH